MATPATATPTKTVKTVSAFAYVSKKTGSTLFLHKKVCSTPSGDRTLFYFSKEKKAEFLCSAVPDGYEVVESDKTGMPMIKKIQPKVAAPAKTAAAPAAVAKKTVIKKAAAK